MKITLKRYQIRGAFIAAFLIAVVACQPTQQPVPATSVPQIAQGVQPQTATPSAPTVATPQTAQQSVPPPPPECAGKKETDANLPEPCKMYFQMLKNPPQGGTGQPSGQPGTPPPAGAGQPQPGGTGQPAGQPGTPPPAGAGQPQSGGTISVQAVSSKYKSAQSKPSGGFTTGQSADILLSGIDFDDTGGPLLFNHPSGMSSDGTRLALADRNNNRVLIWSKLPAGNTPPDLVLGQKDFTTNNPGLGPDQMNWPAAVSIGGGKLVVADTYNDRILIWNAFPTRNAQPADLILQTTAQPRAGYPPIDWTWGVWTDGKKLAVSNTRHSNVLLWNVFPTSADQPPNVTLTAQGKMGTPRGITSNGQYLLVPDHNAKIQGGANAAGMGSSSITFVWKSWPTSDQPHDFVIDGWREGTFTSDNRLVLLSTTHFPPSVWNQPPQSSNDAPNLILEPAKAGGVGGYRFDTGDGSSIASAGGRLYIALDNGNKIVVYDPFPSKDGQPPNFAIGSPDINTNTLETNFILSNPIPATDGKSLFVSSDFDRKMYVWKSIPDQSNAHPDFVYTLPDAPWDNALWKDTLALAGKSSVYVWTKLPRNGETPDRVLSGKIGNTEIQNLAGVALDDRYFYLSAGDKILVWEGVPNSNTEPKFTLKPPQPPQRLDSDGKYLVVNTPGASVLVYRVNELSANAQPKSITGRFNLPGGALAYQGRLFLADTVFNRVLIWNDVADAIAGKEPSVALGQTNLRDVSDRPQIGKDKLFWPTGLAFDGSYLWVGEFKFSERLLRFSVR